MCTCAGVCVGVGFFCSIVVILCVGGGIVMVVMGVVNIAKETYNRGKRDLLVLIEAKETYSDGSVGSGE